MQYQVHTYSNELLALLKSNSESESSCAESYHLHIGVPVATEGAKFIHDHAQNS